MPRPRPFAPLAVLALAACSSSSTTARVPVPIGVRSQPRSLLALAGGAPFAEIEVLEGRPFLLRTLLGPDGTEVLRPLPGEGATRAEIEHPEQRALWVAHGDVEGFDFWLRPDRIRVTQQSVRLRPNGAVHLDLRMEWRDADDRLVLHEARTMDLVAYEGLRIVDVDLTLGAPGEPVHFGDTKDGFFALRLSEGFARFVDGATGAAFGPNGAETPDALLWGTSMRWCAASAPSADGEGRVTVAVFDHPENPRHPTEWQVRPYGLTAANPFASSTFAGREPIEPAFVLAPYATARFRYRVWITDAPVDADAVEAAWQEFAGGAADA